MVGGRESRKGDGYETTKIRYGAREAQSCIGCTTGESTGQQVNMKMLDFLATLTTKVLGDNKKEDK